MTDEELRETEYRGYVARLNAQRDSLAIARYRRAAAERECASISQEINITKRKMRAYEEGPLTAPGEGATREGNTTEG